MRVQAVRDIITPAGFRVASVGDGGRAVPCAEISPARTAGNEGRLLTLFGSRRHAYWVRPEDLRFRGSGAEYIVPPSPPVSPPLPTAGEAGPYHFGSNLRSIRWWRGLSQAELAERMLAAGFPVRQSAVCHREQQADCPGGPFVRAAASGLGVPAFLFFLPLQQPQLLAAADRFLQAASSGLCVTGGRVARPRFRRRSCTARKEAFHGADLG